MEIFRVFVDEGPAACENSRFSSLFAARDVSRGGTSATQRRRFSQAKGLVNRKMVKSNPGLSLILSEVLLCSYMCLELLRSSYDNTK